MGNQLDRMTQAIAGCGVGHLAGARLWGSAKSLNFQYERQGACHVRASIAMGRASVSRGDDVRMRAVEGKG